MIYVCIYTYSVYLCLSWVLKVAEDSSAEDLERKLDADLCLCNGWAQWCPALIATPSASSTPATSWKWPVGMSSF